MSIITISSPAYSGADLLAERVATLLGYRCVSREVLLEASQRYGIPEAKFTEILQTEPHWWERWRENLRLYRTVLRAAMCEVAQGGKLVYHGHGGHEAFPAIQHVLKVLLIAPPASRIDHARAREKIDEADARQLLDQLDHSQTRQLQAIFGTDWRDPARYDLALHMARLRLETAAEVIAQVARQPEYLPTAASEQLFKDLTVSARVQAALAIAPKTRHLNITIRTEQGRVHASGILSQTGLEKEVIQLIESVPGVSRVIADFAAPPIEPLQPF